VYVGLNGSNYSNNNDVMLSTNRYRCDMLRYDVIVLHLDERKVESSCSSNAQLDI
jgi:hypothetical protein